MTAQTEKPEAPLTWREDLVGRGVREDARLFRQWFGELTAPGAGAAEPGHFLGCDLPPDSALKDEGWEWRCNADPGRAREMVDSYRELGFEVRLEPVDTDVLCEACDGCREAMAELNALYVRKAPSPA